MGYLKHIICLLLVAVFLLQAGSNLVIVANYAINQDYIASSLCVNKDKPAMQCNGKCHMVKQMQNENQREQAPANQLKHKHEVWFVEAVAGTSPVIIAIDAITPTSCYNGCLVSGHLADVFHPPQIV